MPFILKSVALILEFLNFNIAELCVCACVHVCTCACGVYKIPLARLVVHTCEVGRELEFEISLSYLTRLCLKRKKLSFHWMIYKQMTGLVKTIAKLTINLRQMKMK